jgi:hypothetical protein
MKAVGQFGGAFDRSVGTLANIRGHLQHGKVGNLGMWIQGQIFSRSQLGSP